MSYFFENSDHTDVNDSVWKGSSSTEKRCFLTLSLDTKLLRKQDAAQFSDQSKLVLILSRHRYVVDETDHHQKCEYCARLFTLVKQFPRSVVLDIGWLKFGIQQVRQTRNFRGFFFCKDHDKLFVGKGVKLEERRMHKIYTKESRKDYKTGKHTKTAR